MVTIIYSKNGCLLPYVNLFLMSELNIKLKKILYFRQIYNLKRVNILKILCISAYYLKFTMNCMKNQVVLSEKN